MTIDECLSFSNIKTNLLFNDNILGAIKCGKMKQEFWNILRYPWNYFENFINYICVNMFSFCILCFTNKNEKEIAKNKQYFNCSIDSFKHYFRSYYIIQCFQNKISINLLICFKNPGYISIYIHGD